MIVRQWIFGAAFFAIAASSGLGQTPDAARIEALVRKLGRSASVQREQARKEIEAIGTPALDALRKAAKTADVETARRIADLVRNFEEQVLVKQILAPKEVHLKLKDASVQEAIAELSKISGYPLQFLGDATRFADEKITLDTGKTSYWNALDLLCKEAGLMERVELAAPPTQTYYPRVAKNGMRRPIYVNPQQAAPPGPTILTNRGKEKSFVAFAGSIKTELRITRVAIENEYNLLHIRRDQSEREYNLMFIVSAEQRLHNGGVTGQPILDKIVDAQGKTLELGADASKADRKIFEDAGLDFDDMAMMQMPRRFAQLRIKEGADAAKQIRLLAGKLTYQVELQNVTLAKIDKVLDATGRTVTTSNGGTLKVNSIRKKEGDFYVVDVALENCSPNPLGNNVLINGGAIIIRGNVNIQGGMIIGPGGVRMNGSGNTKDLPDLVDAKGEKFKVVNVDNDAFSFVNGGSSRSAQILFQANPGQAEPSELILFGTRTHTVTVPFRFENVPLP